MFIKDIVDLEHGSTSDQLIFMVGFLFFNHCEKNFNEKFVYTIF